jgi:hypothetical protein
MTDFGRYLLVLPDFALGPTRTAKPYAPPQPPSTSGSTLGEEKPPLLSSDRAAENEQEQDMNQIDENAWVKGREDEIEQMWTEKLSPAHPAEIPEHELPY